MLQCTVWSEQSEKLASTPLWSFATNQKLIRLFLRFTYRASGRGKVLDLTLGLPWGQGMFRQQAVSRWRFSPGSREYSMVPNSLHAAENIGLSCSLSFVSLPRFSQTPWPVFFLWGVLTYYSISLHLYHFSLWSLSRRL